MPNEKYQWKGNSLGQYSIDAALYFPVPTTIVGISPVGNGEGKMLLSISTRTSDKKRTGLVCRELDGFFDNGRFDKGVYVPDIGKPRIVQERESTLIRDIERFKEMAGRMLASGALQRLFPNHRALENMVGDSNLPGAYKSNVVELLY